MPRNVEIKARIESVETLKPIAAGIADDAQVKIFQDDTFFRCPSGRLKLRTFSDDSGELIYYRRADERGPKESFYLVSQTAMPAILRESLSLAYGETGRVRKHRTLFLIGRTRIHLDIVENLGHFLELEVVLASDESVEQGVAEANRLMKLLGVQPSQLIEGSYVDLLSRKTNERHIPL